MHTPIHADYARYTITDLVADPFFQDWVLQPDANSNAFWAELVRLYPEQTEAVAQARLLLQRLAFKEHMPSDELVEAALQKHLQTINRPKRNLMTWLKVAAVLGGIALCIWLFSDTNSTTKIETAYGSRQRIWLPDSSQVTLNGHSGIRFNKHREVWMEGEGFFNIRHLNKEKFTVYTGNLIVEVLGTSFNIRNRRHTTEVMLQTGRVQIRFRDSSHLPVLMKPGDLVQYHHQTNTLTTTAAIPEQYSAWKEGRLILNNPTVEQIIQYLEDTYGQPIVLQNKELATRRIEGPILLDNLNDALFVISTVLQADVIKNDSSIIIRKRQ